MNNDEFFSSLVFTAAAVLVTVGLCNINTDVHVTEYMTALAAEQCTGHEGLEYLKVDNGDPFTTVGLVSDFEAHCNNGAVIEFTDIANEAIRTQVKP